MIIVYLLSIFSSSFDNKIAPELQSRLINSSPENKIHVIVLMRQPYPYDRIDKMSLKERAELFRNIARHSQAPVVAYLNNFPGKVESIIEFWIYNGFHMNATSGVINEMAKRDDIRLIDLYQAPIAVSCEPVASPTRIPEWNIQRVMADSCWQAGYNGDSVIIALIDGEVDTMHPALSGKFAPWHRGFGMPSYPNFHATYVAGVICGGDGPGPFPDDIGVAPGARLLIAAVGDWVLIDSAMQWIAELKADSGVNIRAAVNSVAFHTNYDLTWWGTCNTLKSLDILPIFPGGNWGPGSGTVGTPGNYPLVIAGGASDQNDDVASFSSRGPALDQIPWNDPQYWYRADWNLIKPDIVAPSAYVRSCIPDSNYAVFNGSSASPPAIAGAVAILCQAYPGLTVTDLYNLLTDNADHPSQGAPYPNNNYGWGRLNVWRALQAVSIAEERGSLVKNSTVLHIYPNPARNFCIIRFLQPKSNSTIRLFDVAGKQVGEITNKEQISDPRIPLNGLAPGVYFVQVDRVKAVGKLVITK